MVFSIASVSISHPGTYPGKYNRSNKKGVHETKIQWIRKKSYEWFSDVKNHPDFDSTYETHKIKCLTDWLNKESANKVQSKEAKDIYVNFLIAIENNTPIRIDNENVIIDQGVNQGDNDNDEEEEIQMEQEVEKPFEVEAQGDVSYHGKDIEINRLITQFAPLELYTMKEDLPAFAVNSRRIQKILQDESETQCQREYEQNWAMKSNEEIIEYFTQIPDHIKSNKTFREKISNLNKSQKSDIRIRRNLDEMISSLQLKGTKEAANEVRILGAASTDLRYNK